MGETVRNNVIYFLEKSTSVRVVIVQFNRSETGGIRFKSKVLIGANCQNAEYSKLIKDHGG
jgi:hypothetical protein